MKGALEQIRGDGHFFLISGIISTRRTSALDDFMLSIWKRRGPKSGSLLPCGIAVFNGSCQLVSQIHFPLLRCFRFARLSNEERCDGVKVKRGVGGKCNGSKLHSLARETRRCPFRSICAFIHRCDSCCWCSHSDYRGRGGGDCLLNGAEANYSASQQERLGQWEKNDSVSKKCKDIYPDDSIPSPGFGCPTVCHVRARPFSLEIMSQLLLKATLKRVWGCVTICSRLKWIPHYR